MLGFSTVQGGSVPLTPILFKGQLYFLICLVISSLTHGLFRTFFFFMQAFCGYKFAPQHCFGCAHKSWLIVFPFFFISKNLVISLLTFFIHWLFKSVSFNFLKFASMSYLEVCCLISNYLGVFQLSLCYWFLISFCDGQRTCMISIV